MLNLLKAEDYAIEDEKKAKKYTRKQNEKDDELKAEMEEEQHRKMMQTSADNFLQFRK